MKQGFLILLVVGAAGARTLDVPGQYTTIQSAILAAAEGDSVLVHPGIYAEPIDFVGKAIVVTGEDPHDWRIVAATAIAHGGPEPIVNFRSGEDRRSELVGLSITDGAAPNGGGIYCRNASPTISRCRINGNRATGPWSDGRGGGAYCTGANTHPVFRRCIISNNTATGGGGASAWAGASATFLGCDFESNSVYWAEGGAINARGGHLTLRKCVFRNNRSDAYAGAVFFGDASSGRVEDCVFVGNTANSWAGGLDVNGGDVEITRSVFYGNTADTGGGMTSNHGPGARLKATLFIDNHALRFGGGIACNGSSPMLENCLLADGSAPRGGGIYALNYSDPELFNCTIAENQSSYGGGVYLYNFSDLLMSSSILWGNRPDQIDMGSFCTTDVFYSNVEGGWRGEGNIEDDPWFAVYKSIPYTLRPVSPCIDRGDPGRTDGVDWRHPFFPDHYHEHNSPDCDMGAFGGPENVAWIGASAPFAAMFMGQ